MVHHHSKDVPLGISLLNQISGRCCPNFNGSRNVFYRALILLLTFFTYTAYHLSRKPISVVKNVLNRNCSGEVPPPSLNISDPNNTHWCDWAPFDGTNSQTLLGTLDSAFLFSYAAGMFISGFVAERMNLRYFLSAGMILSGLFTCLFGLAFSQNIHSLPYFILIQALAGFTQSTGWPGVVTAVGNWFGKSKRGLIFGIWNSHTSVGNILGSLIAGHFVMTNWGSSFIYPGVIIAVMGVIIFLFLVSDPHAVGLKSPHHHHHEDEARSGYSAIDGHNGSVRRSRALRRYANASGSASDLTVTSDPDPEREALLSYDDSVETQSIESSQRESSSSLSSSANADVEAINVVKTDAAHKKAIGFFDALKIPGVVEFSLCLFFAKLINYTFLFWLPVYIRHSTSFDATQSADLSTLFDVGGIVGGIIAGVASDMTGMSAVTCSVMLILSIPALFVYQTFGAINLTTNIILLMVVGMLVNGPYALITTAVSTELGTHQSLKGSSKALATVTAIIDGTGSIGAAVGPLLAGPVSDFGWDDVFYMLMAADVMALVLLTRLVIHDVQRFREQRREAREKLERIA